MKNKKVYEEKRDMVHFYISSAIIRHSGIHAHLHIVASQATLILLSVNQFFILIGANLKVDYYPTRNLCKKVISGRNGSKHQ